jgi:hypothetical protein
MKSTDLELVYEDLAMALDAVEAEKRELFLAKLALLLAHEIGDVSLVRRHISDACDNLDV